VSEQVRGLEKEELYVLRLQSRNVDLVGLCSPIRPRGMFRTASDILCKDGDLHASSVMVEMTMGVIPAGQQLVVLQGGTIDIDREHGIHVLIGLDTTLQNMDLVLEMQQTDHALGWGFVHDGGGNHLVHQLGVLLGR